MTIGHSISSASVQELEGLDLSSLTEAHIADALILSRPGGSDPRRLAASLTNVGVPARVEEHAGTETLLDCAAEQSVVPVAILDRIVRYLTEAAGSAVSVRHDALPSIATLVAPGAHAWTEEHFSVGRSGLAGVLTLPRKQRRSGAVVMVNNGVARSIGPARAWVEWSRIWAELGIASLRMDLSGLGDSEPRSGHPGSAQYPIEAIDDFADAIEELRSRGLAPAVAVGLCSGAFLSLDAAAA